MYRAGRAERSCSGMLFPRTGHSPIRLVQRSWIKLEPPGLLFQYFPLWAQVAILIVVLLPALVQAVEALIRVLVPRHPRPPRPRPFYRDSRQQPVLRQQVRRKRNVTP